VGGFKLSVDFSNKVTRVTQSIWVGLTSALCILVVAISAVNAADFESAKPGYRFNFPRDFAAHNTFQTEWWYFVGHLWTDDKKPYSYELTFFRKAIAPPSAFAAKGGTDNLILTVFAITDVEGNKFFFRQKYDSFSSGKVEAPENTFKLRHGNWSIKPDGNNLILKADGTDFSIDLIATPEKPPIPMGKDGFARYGDCEGCGTHYYVLSRLLTEGTLTVKGVPHKVIGLTFNEHQWGTRLISPDEIGWVWTCIQFANKTELILCHFPRNDGKLDQNSQAAFIRPDSSVEYFNLSEFKMKPLAKWRSDKSQQLYPVGADIEIPRLKMRVVTMPDVLDQELPTSGFTYYEGHGAALGDFGGGAALLTGKPGVRSRKPTPKLKVTEAARHNGAAKSTGSKLGYAQSALKKSGVHNTHTPANLEGANQTKIGIDKSKSLPVVERVARGGRT
jgi:predicted secreted hydrolase